MTIKLTKKQLLLLDFIKEYTEAHNLSPSYREIMAGVGLKSVSAVAEHINNLVEKGVVKKVPNASRSLELVDYRHDETVTLFKSTLPSVSDEDRDILLKAADILGLDLEN